MRTRRVIAVYLAAVAFQLAHIDEECLGDCSHELLRRSVALSGQQNDNSAPVDLAHLVHVHERVEGGQVHCAGAGCPGDHQTARNAFSTAIVLGLAAWQLRRRDA